MKRLLSPNTKTTARGSRHVRAWLQIAATGSEVPSINALPSLTNTHLLLRRGCEAEQQKFPKLSQKGIDELTVSLSPRLLSRLVDNPRASKLPDLNR